MAGTANLLPARSVTAIRCWAWQCASYRRSPPDLHRRQLYHFKEGNRNGGDAPLMKKPVMSNTS